MIVDNRIVSLKFDKRDFEKNVDGTLKALENLDKNLNLRNMGDELKNIGRTAGNLNLSNISSSAESVGRSFSALEVMAITALANISNSVVNLGKRMVSNLITPITKGGLQRAMNIELANFQFEGQNIERQIRANGEREKSYKEVMDAVLGTAYSYDVAAKAAAQLAASGIGVKKVGEKNGKDLLHLTDEMTDSLLAMAGLASMTGSSFEDMSEVFTRIAGQNRVMSNDLNSIAARGINAASYVAKYLNYINKSTDYTEAKVRDMVTKGEVDFRLFSSAMNWAFGAHAKKSTEMFTGALEDVKAALSRIGADFYGPALTAARDALNSMVPVIDIIHARLGNSLAFAAKVMGKTSKAFAMTMNTMSTIMTNDPISWMADYSERFTSVMDKFEIDIKLRTEDLNTISKNGFNAAKILGKYLGKSEKTIRNMVSQGKIDLTTLAKAFVSLANEAKKPGEVLKKLTPIMNDIFGARITGKFAKLQNIFKGIGTIFSSVKKIVVGVAKIFGQLFTASLPLVDLFVSLTSGLATFISKGAEAIEKFKIFEHISKGVAVLCGGLEKIFDTFSRIFDKLVSKVGSIGDVFDALFKSVTKTASSIFGLASLGGLGVIFTSLGKALKNFAEPWRLLGAFPEMFKNLYTSSTNLLVMIRDLRVALQAWQQNLKANILLKLAVAVGVLAISMRVLSSLDAKALAIAVAGVQSAMYGLVGAVNLLSFKGGMNTVGLTSMIKIVFSVFILASAMKKLGSLSWEGIGKGLVGVAALFSMLVGTIKILSKDAKRLKVGLPFLLGIAVALNIMTKSVISLASLSLERMGQGLMGLGLMILGLIGLFEYLSTKKNGSKLLISTSISILLISVALNIMAKALKTLGVLSFKDMSKGLFGIGVLLLGIVAVGKLLEKSGKNFLLVSAGMVAMGFALKLMVNAVAKIGNMKLEQMAQGILAIIFLLLMLVGVTTLLQGNLLGAATLIVIAIAMNILMTAIAMLGSLSLETLAKGIGAIVIAIAAIAGVAMILSPAIVPLFGLAIAFLLLAGVTVVLGIGLGKIGVGFVKIGAGLKALAGLEGQVGLFAKVLLALAGCLIPLGIAALIAGPGLLMLGGALALAGIGVLLIATGIKILSEGLIGLARTAPLMPLIVEGLTQLAKVLGKVSFAALGLIVGAPMILVLAVGVTLLSAGMILVNSQSSSFTANIKMIVKTVKSLEGITSIISSLRGSLTDLAKSLSNSANKMKETAYIFRTVGVSISDELIKGIEGSKSKIQNRLNNILKYLVTIIRNYYDNFKRAGAYIATGLAKGIKSKDYVVAAASRSVAAEAIKAARNTLKERSPSKVFFKIGEYVTQGLANGIIALKSKVRKSTENVADESISSMSRVMSNVSSLMDSNLDITPRITPVVDSTGALAAANQLNSAFSSNQAYGVSATLNGSKSENNSIVDAVVSGVNKAIQNFNPEDKTERVYKFEIPFNMDNREFAKATATYTQQELEGLEFFEGRLKGEL